MADDDNQAAGLDEASHAESPISERGGSESWFSDKDPGWYNLGANPNEQSYWDGQRWSGVRHWVAGRGWMEGGAVTGGRSSSGQAAPRLNANPYAQAVTAPARPARTPAPATLSVGVLMTVVAGIALMYGSVGTWIQVNGSVGRRPLQRLTERHRPGHHQPHRDQRVHHLHRWDRRARSWGPGPVLRRAAPRDPHDTRVAGCPDHCDLRHVQDGAEDSGASCERPTSRECRMGSHLRAECRSARHASSHWRGCSASASRVERDNDPAGGRGIREPGRCAAGGSCYCGGPELSCTVAVCVCPLASVHATCTLSPGW